MIFFTSSIDDFLFRLRPVDYEEVTIDDTVRTLTAAKAASCRYAALRLDSGDAVRFLFGADPSSTVGYPMLAFEQVVLNHDEATTWRAVRTSTLNMVARVFYYSRG